MCSDIINTPGCMPDTDDERQQLLEWIPKLVSEHLEELDTGQLRLLHYILGYHACAADEGDMVESMHMHFEEAAAGLLQTLERMGFIVINRPY